MKIACIGIGAVGSIIARELKKLDANVTLYSRTERPHFTILEDGEYTVHHHTVYPLDAHTNETYDIIFIATKATQLKMLSRYMPNMSHTSTEIILCENGMGYEQYFTRPIPSVVYISGQKHKDYIEHFRDSRLIIENKPFKYIDRLISMIKNQSSVVLNIVKDSHFEKLRYEKLLINLGVNTMTALTQNTAQIFTDKDIIQLTGQLLKEGQSIINQYNEIINDAFIEEAINLYKSYPPHMGTSMYYDVMNRTDTEYQFIQQYFYNHKKDIETPVLDVIYVLLKGYHIKTEKN